MVCPSFSCLYCVRRNYHFIGHVAEKVAVKISTEIAIGRFAAGATGNAFARWKLGY